MRCPSYASKDAETPSTPQVQAPSMIQYDQGGGGQYGGYANKKNDEPNGGYYNPNQYTDPNQQQYYANGQTAPRYVTVLIIQCILLHTV